MEGSSNKDELPDLAKTLQAMTIAEPGLSIIQSNQLPAQDDLDFSHCLIMKVACSGGTPRNISLQSLKQAMAKVQDR